MSKAMQVCEALEDKYNEKRIKNEYESGIVMGIQICVEAIRELPADPVADDLARLMAENERLKKSIDNYRSEWETPVPDLTLRIRYRKELFAALKGSQK